MSIQLAHCTRSKFDPWGRLITFIATAMVVITLIGKIRSGDVNFKLCITLLCGVTTVFQWQFILSIIGEITTILGIEVFTTKQEQQRRNLEAQSKAKLAKLKQQVKTKKKPTPLMKTISDSSTRASSKLDIASEGDTKPYQRNRP